MMKAVKETLERLIREGLASLGVEAVFSVEHPTNLAFGDYSTNAGIVSKRSAELAAYLAAHQPPEIERVEIRNGFINFFLSAAFFRQSLGEIIEKGDEFGKNESLKGEKVMVEHTDPNPFKEFHIGHLMPNVIGSTLARLCAWNGAEVRQANYQGDVGMHVAKAIWGVVKQDIENVGMYINTGYVEEKFIQKLANGDFYAQGDKDFREHEDAKKSIKEINSIIYKIVNNELSDDNRTELIRNVYNTGKRASLYYFETIYQKLGTNFDFYFFESEAAPIGKRLVEAHIGDIFERSDGAVVFHAEEYDPALHTRVFINSDGLPTYEAKELGLAELKAQKYAYTKSIVVTANEINDYFRVLLAAMRLVLPDLAAKTVHVSHGMLRLPSGKMSSRTGDVITAVSLIEQVKQAIKEKGQEPSDEIAVGAIKYMILKQAIGGDVVFDFKKSVSIEGDSGVYLQYAYARTRSLLAKAEMHPSLTLPLTRGGLGGMEHSGEVRSIERLLYRFPEVVERAGREYAPHYITTYLIELAGAFNNFYAHEQVISDDAESPYRLAIVEAFGNVLGNGLSILGIPAPERM